MTAYRVKAEKIPSLSLGRGNLTKLIKKQLRVSEKPLAAEGFDFSSWPFFRFCYKNNAFAYSS